MKSRLTNDFKKIIFGKFKNNFMSSWKVVFSSKKSNINFGEFFSNIVSNTFSPKELFTSDDLAKMFPKINTNDINAIFENEEI